MNPNQLEEAYREFTQNLPKWIPDGVIPVDLKLLHELGMLKNGELDHPTPDNLNQPFHVVETPEKVTLFNEKFAVWIVPSENEETSSTLTFIALLNAATKPHLEIVFSTSGVYNAPKYILKILQHFLTEVQDTETMINDMDKKIS
jgi:hypothetical protein